MTTYDGARSDKRKAREVQGSSQGERLDLSVYGGRSGNYSCACDGDCPVLPCDNDRTDLFTIVARIVADRLRAVEHERDHCKMVAERRGETMNAALLESQRLLERVMDGDRALGDLQQRLRALIADWQANGGSRALGDPTDRVWYECATQLLTALKTDGGA